MAQRSPGRVVRLADVVRPRPGNSKLIKGKLPSQPGPGLYPAFSASGQDTYAPVAEHLGNAVVVSAVGARCGKCFLASGHWSAIANTHVLLPDESQIDVRFLWYRVNDERFWTRGGSAQPFVRVRESLEREICLPPLHEQKEIVAELELQLSRLDEAVANLKRVKANLKRYEAAVLSAAVSGRLLESLAPASPHSQSWPLVPCGEVIDAIQAGASFKCVERPPSSDEIGVVKVSAVTWGEYDENESKTCVDPARVKDDFFIESGDFLFSRANTIELVGACVIVKSTSRRIMLSDKILRFRLAPTIDPEWLLICLRSKDGRRQIEQLATGNQASMRNIGQERIRQIRVPLPSIDQQRYVTTEAHRLLSVTKHLEGQLERAEKTANVLRSAIITEAFSGKNLENL